MDINKEWIGKGFMGCTFAAMFSRKPETIGWFTVTHPSEMSIPENASILSLQFPEWDKHKVKDWALANGFYLENVSDGLKGLRYNVGNKIAWVQYIGFDADVKTRMAPIPELIMCVKLPPKQYFKVGFNGILHLAHASIMGLTGLVADTLWRTSHENTERRLGKKPTIREAAKTTYHE